MQDYLTHRRALVSKSKKTATASSSSSVVTAPAVSSAPFLGSSPSLPFVSDDEEIKDYVHSFLSSFFFFFSVR